MTAFNGRALLLILVAVAVLIWFACGFDKANRRVDRSLSDALGPQHHGRRDVHCDTHGYLCTVDNDRDARLELAAHLIGHQVTL